MQRIAQNLLLNALGVTERGGVWVQWAARTVSGVHQWLLCVLDTGPGLQHDSPAAPLERALQEATAEAHEAEDRGSAPSAPPAPTLRSQSSVAARNAGGEGIGLSIVKRLCELLDASLELETAPGEGTTFRVVFPCAYPQDRGVNARGRSAAAKAAPRLAARRTASVGVILAPGNRRAPAIDRASGVPRRPRDGP